MKEAKATYEAKIAGQTTLIAPQGEYRRMTSIVCQ
jgi:hypothetical protein